LKPIRTAVVGYGHLGKIHARILRTLPQFEAVVVVDPMEAARAAAAATGIEFTSADHREWIERVDAVVLASPTKFHHAVACDFLKAGKHVFVEKPLTSSVAEGEELVDLARRNRVALQVGHVERFNPGWTTLTSRISQPRFIEARREGMFSFRSTDIGVVLDLMVHDLDLIASLVGSPVVDVEASGTPLLGRHEDIAYARLRFASGCVAVVHASRIAQTATRQMRVQTDAALATLDFQTRRVQLTHFGAPLRSGAIDVERMTTAEKNSLKDNLTSELLRTECLESEPQDAITAELYDFADSILTGRSPRVSGSDGLIAVSLAEQILSALRAERAAEQYDKPSIVRPPHWHLRSGETVRRREAG
jgi:predicted dehydrogenase